MGLFGLESLWVEVSLCLGLFCLGLFGFGLFGLDLLGLDLLGLRALWVGSSGVEVSLGWVYLVGVSFGGLFELISFGVYLSGLGFFWGFFGLSDFF